MKRDFAASDAMTPVYSPAVPMVDAMAAVVMDHYLRHKAQNT